VAKAAEVTMQQTQYVQFQNDGVYTLLGETTDAERKRVAKGRQMKYDALRSCQELFDYDNEEESALKLRIRRPHE
jgi:hypothetical protein